MTAMRDDGFESKLQKARFVTWTIIGCLVTISPFIIIALQEIFGGEAP